MEEDQIRMTDNTGAQPGGGQPTPGRRALGRGAVRRVFNVLGGTVFMGLTLFLAAGTVRWTGAWVWLGANVFIFLVNGALLLRLNPEIIDERGRRHEGTKRFDKILSAAITPFFFGILVIAGLDAVRFGWSTMSPWWVVWGLVLLAFSDVLSVWSMVVNRHLETTVRIQSERGHTVVTAGPYRFVRHPMYVSMCIQFGAWPFILGSWWALVPVVVVDGLFVVRTALEDRMLRAELPGYEDYAQRTRYRLVPLIW